MGDKTTITNGDLPHSAFVEHIASYPVISSGIETYKSYPLGAQTISLASQGYYRFILPWVNSQFAQESIKPKVSPYLTKVDSFGDSSLDTIDAHIPALKKEPQELQGHLLRYVQYPFKVADEGRQHIFTLYNNEYKKCGGDGYVAGAKALVTTSLVTTSETLSAVATWLSRKEHQVASKVKAEMDSN